MLINKPKLLGLTSLFSIILFTAWGISTTAAQSYQKEPLTWGVKAGISSSDLYGDDVGGSDARAGFNGGLFFNYRFDDNWGLQPEVLFSNKGAELESGLSGGNSPTEYELGYLSIPILAKFYIPASPYLIPNLYGGPDVGFKLYGDANGSDINDQLKDAEFGLAFGAGLDYNLGTDPVKLIRTVGLDLRYTLGLTSILDTPEESEVRNGVFSATINAGF